MINTRNTAGHRTSTARPTLLFLFILVATGCGDASSTSAPPFTGSGSNAGSGEVDATEVRSGGDTTVDRAGTSAFSGNAANLTLSERSLFDSGNLLFRTPQDGLGPHFNSLHCQACHVLDGRGNPPADNSEVMVSMLMRAGVVLPGGIVEGDPVYGTQIQTDGVSTTGPPGCPTDGLAQFEGAINGCGAIGEAFPLIEYEIVPGTYADGTPYALNKPTYVITDPSYGPFSDDLRLSPRVSPSVIGMGLLGAIPVERLMELEDPMDVDTDGISGRIHWRVDPTTTNSAPGRYGLKAGEASILSQTVGAFQNDLGTTSSFATEEPCTDSQAACLAAAAAEPNDEAGGVDVSNLVLAFIEFYSRTLAVPARRGFIEETGQWETRIARGRAQFTDLGCAGCHTPRHVTGTASGSILGDISGLSLSTPAEPISALSNQIIWPYTDLLLHDMGGSCDSIARENSMGAVCTTGADCFWVQRCEGLADDLPEGEATGTEWRTPPLWGLGLVQTVNPRAGFLHDGRARTIEEAVLWHGGEALIARNQFMQLSLSERLDVLAFLESM